MIHIVQTRRPQLYFIQNVFSLYICQYSEVFLHTDTHPAGLPPKKMVLWDILSKAAPEGLWLSSFLMEMETNHSDVAQTEANTYQEDQVTKCKETEAHAMEGETLLKQEGHTETVNTEGNICNGESLACVCVFTFTYIFIYANNTMVMLSHTNQCAKPECVLYMFILLSMDLLTYLHFIAWRTCEFLHTRLLHNLFFF